MNSQFISAVEQICEEKNLSKEVVLEAIEQAIGAAYKRDYGDKDQELRVELNNDDGSARIFVLKEVLDEIEDEMLQISLEDAKELKKDAEIGQTIEIEDMNTDYGRVAAQTAKQVIVQKIREAERENVFNEYQDKIGTVVNGNISRYEYGKVFVDLGKGTGIVLENGQVQGERYFAGQKMKFYIEDVDPEARGPQVILSRTSPELIRELFSMEVPELSNESVEISGIAREAGGRTKIAVSSNIDGVDPVGTFVGGHGSRVQSVMNELNNEKIDIINFSEDNVEYIGNALSPTTIDNISINEEDRLATVTVAEDQLSLAIGKSGQNVRLAAKLTGYKIDIVSSDNSNIEQTEKAIEDIKDIEDEKVSEKKESTEEE